MITVKKCKMLLNYIQNRFVKRVFMDGSPTFVVSCGHSGSSVLLNILGTHSNIYAIPGEMNVPKWKNPRKAVKRFDFLAMSAGKKRWVEKTPIHIRSIKFLKDQWPSAKFIIILRDGRDVSLSLKKRFGDVEFGARRWVNDNLCGEAYWGEDYVKVIRYESLVEDPDGVVRDVLNFVGEEYESQCLQFHRVKKNYYSEDDNKPSDSTQKNHKQYRNWQINQPLFDGRGKWKELTESEKQIVKEIANKKLIEYGYVTNDEW